jgi:uncharacterized protein YndB with AHSA1/START domain
VEFSSKEDINASVEQVFAILSDIEAVERQALRRGVEVRRTTPHQEPAAGMGWQAVFKFRGRKRTSDISLTEFTPPSRMVFESRTGGLETRFEIDLMELSRAHTRVTTTALLMPKTLSARLLVQSMKLAKSKIARRYAVRMAQFARDVEERAGKLA